MTLILTHINRYGIVHASDSNLTGSDNKDAGTGQKTFPITFLQAGLTVAGAYSVSGIAMHRWMSDFIQRQQKEENVTLETFCNKLKDELQTKMTTTEKMNGSLIHVAGYVEDESLSHPEFWFISNVHGINETTGEYQNVDETFAISEDFWNRDCPRGHLMEAFKDENDSSWQYYVNGFTPGRIGYNVVSKKLVDFFSEIWSVKEWRFRPPKSLKETEILVKLYMQVINDLFLLSDYSAKVIGGDTQTLIIDRPNNITDKCKDSTK